MNVLARASSCRKQLVAAVLVAVVVLVALAGAPAARGVDDCVGRGCEADDVAVGATSSAPVRQPTVACLHDAGCGGAQADAGAGLVLVAVAGAVVLVGGDRRRAPRVLTQALRSLLSAGQLYRPPRFA